MMVCPVVDKGAKTRVVYLPEGEWTNYWTKEVFQGKQHISVLCPLDQIPIFIKGGAIIPMQESQNYVGEKEITNYDLHIYPNGKSAFTLYADDGKSLNYTSGEFATTIIETEESEEYVHLKIQQPKGSYVSSIATYTLVIHLSKKPSSIAINNNSMNISQLNYTNGVLQIEVSAHELQDVKIVK
ncbi:DUF5110 domain-containing protein [Maribacter sp. MAR_2009_72]|uniref:DUF5110 domain-containing protein n=1 Tax=Maribacter sp. MAR_2009_72 TaxID=1250050 RepID=UPI001C98A40E|nr:DUF5110 domain-containing protein [Maribacter sp. MAR_2009_72]